MRHALLPFVPTLLLPVLPCQATPDRILVLAQQATPPRAVLYEVTPATGAVTALPGFPSDALPPLAMAVDPATREPVLALQAPAGAVLVRVHVVGQQVLGERVLGTLPGPVVGVCVPATGDLYAAVDGAAGGIYRVARQCCGATLFWGGAGLSALSEPVVLPGKFWGARDLPGAPALAAFLDDVPGAPQVTSILTMLAGARITGVHEYVQSGRHQLLVDTLGRVHTMDVWPWTLAPVALAPAIPAGGAIRMKGGPAGQVFVLGGVADPTLKSFPQSSLQVVRPVTIVAGPFAGTPVDFAFVAGPTARTVRFAAPCTAPAGGTIAADGAPVLGNAAFALRLVDGLPGSLSLLAAGASDRAFLGLPLPLPFGTCSLVVAPEFLFVHVSDAAGAATQGIPVPATPVLAGQVFFAQWAQDLAVPRTSDALALHLF